MNGYKRTKKPPTIKRPPTNKKNHVFSYLPSQSLTKQMKDLFPEKSPHQNALENVEFLEGYIEEQERIGSEFFGGSYELERLRQDLYEAQKYLALFDD